MYETDDEDWVERLFGHVEDCEEDLGSVQGFGWYGLMALATDASGNLPWVILHEDSQGNKTATQYDTKDDVDIVWAELNFDYISWCGQSQHD